MVAKECDAIACQRCSPRTAANCDERCRCQPKGISPRIPQRGLRKRCWLRLWIVLRLWMSGVFQLLGTLRNKLLCTLRHLRQQLRHSLRASEIRLRRTVRTDFLLRVPAASPRAPKKSLAPRTNCPVYDGASVGCLAVSRPAASPPAAREPRAAKPPLRQAA